MKRTKLKIVLALAASLALTACGKSPESTVESFYKALGKGEIKEAVSYLSKQITENFGEKKITQGMTAEAQRIALCGGVKSVKSELKGEGDVRAGQTTVVYGDAQKCPEKTEKAALVKEDGTWKIGMNK